MFSIYSVLFLKSLFSFCLYDVVLYSNMLYLYLKHTSIPIVTNFLKNHTYTKAYLMDLVVVDYPSEKKRFKVIYSLLSYKINTRLHLVVYVQETEHLLSISNIYPASNWLEREVWDMFGICFFNHPDLRRIFTDYSFYGFALRKDFPLTGFLELQYDFNQKRIVQDFVSLSQDVRFFHYQTPWSTQLTSKPTSKKLNG